MAGGSLGRVRTSVGSQVSLSVKSVVLFAIFGCCLLLPYGSTVTPTSAIPAVRQRITPLKRLATSEVTTLHDATLLPRELYEAVHADPSLLNHKAVADTFLPTPWLLPSGAHLDEVLGYQGLHNDLDGLLRVRSQDIGSMDFLDDEFPATETERDSRGAISVVYFGKSHTLLMQNWVYTAVRWGGITNYIVATWEEGSLQACLAMNLPCFNASAYPPLPIQEGVDAKFRSTAFVSITWVKPLLTRDILERGYHVHSSDVDIAFPPKAFWPSMLRFLVPARADVAMERDLWGPVNTGCVVLRPTEYAKAWMAKRVARAKEQAEAGITEQGSAMQLKKDAFQLCQGPWDCEDMAVARERERETGGDAGPRWALVRRYHSAWDAMYQDHCAGARLKWLKPIDPCQPGHTNYHVICVTGASGKIQGFKGAGLWFLDEGPTSGCTSHPLEGLPEVTAQQAAAAAQRFLERTEGSGHLPSLSGFLSDGHASREGARAEFGIARELGEEGEPHGVQQRLGRRLEGAGVEVDGSGEAEGGGGPVLKCRPLHWRLRGQEASFASCNRSQLAWVAYPPVVPF